MAILRRKSPRGYKPSNLGQADDLIDLPLEGAGPAGREASIRGSARRAAGPRRGEIPGARLGRWVWLLLILALPLTALLAYLLRPGPPIAALSNEILDFGAVRIGGEGGDLALRVVNQGKRDLRIAATALTGAAAEDFRLIADGCAGFEIAQADACTLRFAFGPAARGPRRARIELISNGEASRHIVELIGIGTAPELAVKPRRLEWSRLKVGTRGSAARLAIENRGTSTLEVGRLAIEGPAARDFRSLDDRCSGKSLEPGEGCTSGFVFIPRAPGERRAAVRIAHDAAQDPERVELVGRGLELTPRLRVEPEGLDFGALLIGEASPPLIARVANDGDGPLAVRGALVDGVAGFFELVEETCTAERIAPGGGCELQIRFLPGFEGRVEAALRIEHNAGAEPHLLGLTGFGTAPGLAAEPGRVAFGDVRVGRRSAVRNVRLTSTGSGALGIRSLAVDGADARSFEAAAEGCSRRLEPGDACVVEVRFMPRRSGPHRASLVIRHSAGEGRLELPLNGLATQAVLSLDKSRLEFGELLVGQEKSLGLEVRNSGRADLEVKGLRLTGGRDADLEVAADRCSGRAVPPGGACRIELRFAPVAAGARNVRLVIDHSAAQTPRQVTVTGRATVPPVPEIRAEPSTLEFSERRVGERGPIRTLTLQNPGTARLVLGGMGMIGDHAGDFELVSGSCDGAPYIAPGASCTLGLRFTPRGEGRRRARLVIEHNAGLEPAVVRLAGHGTAPPPLP